MKKLFIWVAAVALCVSCSQEEVTAPPSGGDSGLIADGEAKHLTVNIIAAGENGTRATGEPDNAEYEDGSAKENKVSAVRFYFYDDNGNSANVKADGTNTLYWENPGVGSGETPNVEKILQAKLIISTKAGDKLPTKVVAVLNPEMVNLGKAVGDTKGLDEIRNILSDYADHANKATGSNDEAGQFAMINSAYADDSKVEYFATEIKPQNYAPNAVAAETDPKPVEIYVERATAKVRVQLNPELVAEDGYIALKNKEGEDINVHINGVPSQIYLKLSSNWNLTAATDKGSLGKYIDATWATDYLGAQRWTYAPYFRSYWAENPAGVTQTWSSYNDLFGANAGTQYSTTANKYEQYTNENAPQDKNVTAISGGQVEPFTKVIMAGELCYKTEDGYEVLPLGKFLGAKYVGESNLIDAMLEYLQKSGSMIYSYEENPSAGTAVAFKGIEKTDVKLLTALKTIDGGVTIPNLDATEQTTGRYNVYLQLSDAGKDKKWTKSDKDSDYKAADQILANPTDVNQYLANALGGAQMYTSGNTYYFFPIRHLGDNTGEHKVGYYGIVRNHIYDCTINSITGLGTPVYDPDEVIYPEIPQEDETFIAAKINILSWRIVSNGVDLEWE